MKKHTASAKRYATLYDWRAANMLSQIEACRFLGVPQGSYSKWENSLAHPRRDMLRRIVELTGVSVAFLAGVGVEQNPTQSQADAKASPIRSGRKHTGSHNECYGAIPKQIKTRFGGRPGPERKSLTDRLEARTDKSAGPLGCWLFTGARTVRGYGQLLVEGRDKQRVYAHRAAYELAHGPIPAGRVVCHSCDTPSCVNPSHLFLGSQADNVRDSHAKGRFTAWHRTGVRLNGQAAKA